MTETPTPEPSGRAMTTAPGASDAAHLYDAYYYATGCGRPYARDTQWLDFFAGIAGRICRDIQPGTVLDAGCAWGLLVEALRQRAVHAFGIDLSEYAIEQVPPEIKPYCRVGSVTQPFPQQYDLIVCIEVLEHMPHADAEQAIVNFCRHTQDVLFSSTPFDYKEATHFNVQPPEYWAEQFAQHGFYRDVDFDASFITPWAVRFRRRAEPVPRLVRDYERRFFLLVKENSDLRQLTVEMRDQLAEQERSIQELQTGGSASAQLQAIHASRSWRLLMLLGRLRRWLMFWKQDPNPAPSPAVNDRSGGESHHG